MQFDQKNTGLIIQDFELSTDKDQMSEEEFLAILAERMEYMIEYRMEFLLSLMYRLDIAEHKINFALSPLAADPPALGLAKLVVERQKERLATKQQYKSKDVEEGDEWEW
ncbi:MAG: hypothetical protein R2879_00845 [Saprospiraceae bacterium]|jgi:hypothetical protein